MADDTENLTLRLLQEMRARFDTIDGKLDDLSTRVDGNTLLLNIVAGLNHDHEQRITKLDGES